LKNNKNAFFYLKIKKR